MTIACNREKKKMTKDREETDMDGEAWKRKAQRDSWNSPEKIALDEYTSIIIAYREHVLRPIVQKGQKLDRTTVALTKSDLEWKLKDPTFENLPFNIKSAYQNFLEFIKVLESSTESEVKASKDILKKLFDLSIKCDVYGAGMKYDKGRNPCRTDQYAALSVIAKAEQRRSSQLVEAARKMVDTCLRCPYK